MKMRSVKRTKHPAAATTGEEREEEAESRAES
jgi:hypothetical protein